MSGSSIRVRKYDGSFESYDKEKIAFFCLRMGASENCAEDIADKVEARLYDGISTKEILQLAKRYLKLCKLEFGYRRDLRSAICMLRSKPDWELFVQLLMRKVGYEVEGSRVLNGKCVENEIDGILRKNSETIMLEVKHHQEPHSKTSLETPKETWATYIDLMEGYKLAHHRVDFTSTLIVCNTKFSNIAIKYADCRGVGHLGWKDPSARGLEKIIEEEKFYPVTILREVDRETATILGDKGIILLKHLLDLKETPINTGIKKEKIERLFENARKLI